MVILGGDISQGLPSGIDDKIPASSPRPPEPNFFNLLKIFREPWRGMMMVKINLASCIELGRGPEALAAVGRGRRIMRRKGAI
jgi:hypothetical protein